MRAGALRAPYHEPTTLEIIRGATCPHLLHLIDAGHRDTPPSQLSYRFLHDFTQDFLNRAVKYS